MPEYSLSWSREGEPFEPPINASAWRVRRVGPDWGEYSIVTVRDPQLRCYVPLVLHLRATHEDLREAVEGNSGMYCLEPIDDRGRVLSWTAAYAAVRDPDGYYSYSPSDRNYASVSFPRCNYMPKAQET